MKRFAVFMSGVILAGSILSCGQVSSQRTYEGAAVGAAVGAVAGVLLDKENRWRGGVIGAALGAVLGGTITEIAQRAAREAASSNKPVEYRAVDNSQWVRAEPVAKEGECTIVKTKYYQNGELVKVEERKVCP